ncbi:MAG: hypothetical protein ACP5US_09330 [Candidatus Kryptoniota bacterium]
MSFVSSFMKLLLILCLTVVSLSLLSCAKKPTELYADGIKQLKAGYFKKAQEYFADGIKKDGGDSLYAAFIAANLVTGKYPDINSAYNDFTSEIRGAVEHLYGYRFVHLYGITSKIIPYNVKGGNQIPDDFYLIVQLQIASDYPGFMSLKQLIYQTVKR